MRILLPLLGVLLSLAPYPLATEPDAASPAVDCRSAAAASEQSAALPPGLLLAIGQVESGRWDPIAGRTDPWPWATNNAGEGHYFNSVQEAIAWTAAQLASGIRSIDVGCFQVNLFYHPDAFASLAEAFDPATNARYAAVFLNRLHDQSGSWASAIALYHSADPSEGERYSSRVMAAWHGGVTIAAAPVIGSVRSADPVIVRISAMAAVVRVVVPGWAAAQPVASVQVRVAGLPRVITPGH